MATLSLLENIDDYLESNPLFSNIPDEMGLTDTVRLEEDCANNLIPAPVERPDLSNSKLKNSVLMKNNTSLSKVGKPQRKLGKNGRMDIGKSFIYINILLMLMDI